MESTNLISEGLTLLVFGMGFVFVFLTLLVGATSAMSKVVGKYIPDPAPVFKRPATPAPSAAAPAAQDNAQLVAVLTAAVKAHRARR